MIMPHIVPRLVIFSDIIKPLLLFIFIVKQNSGFHKLLWQLSCLLLHVYSSIFVTNVRTYDNNEFFMWPLSKSI